MKRLLAVLAVVAGGAALLGPAGASAAPASSIEPVFTDASPRAVPECAAPEQSAWMFVHRTAPFPAAFGGGILRLTFNAPMAYGESHPDFYTETPIGLADFTLPAGAVVWSFAGATDASRIVDVPFVCPFQNAPFNVQLDFFPTPKPPVVLGGRTARGQWSLLVVRVDEPSVLSVQVNGAALSYRFDDANAPTLTAPPGQTVVLGPVQPGEHGLFVTPQADTLVDWTAAFTASTGAAAPGGGGYGEQPPVTTKKPPARKRPVMRKRPRVVGVARVGRTVRCQRGTFTGATKYQIRWLRGSKLIKKQTKATYRLRKVDRGRNLSCQVRASNAVGAITVRSKPVRVKAAKKVVKKPAKPRQR